MKKITVTAPMGLTVPAGVKIKVSRDLAARFADRVEAPVKGVLTVAKPVTVKAGVVFEVEDTALLGKAASNRYVLGEPAEDDAADKAPPKRKRGSKPKVSEKPKAPPSTEKAGVASGGSVPSGGDGSGSDLDPSAPPTSGGAAE